MKNLLVTGGAGFIGSNFIHYLLQQDPDVKVVNLDALTYAGSLENLKYLPHPERHLFVHGNITDCALLDQLFSEHKIDTVVNFAAESHVDRSILNPGVFVETNVSAPTPCSKPRAVPGSLIRSFRLKKLVFTMSPPMRFLAR